MVQVVPRDATETRFDMSDVQDAHAQVRESIEHLMDRFLFGDWQKVTPQDLQQAAARIRSMKIRYLVSGGHEVASSAPLSALNELYLQLCLALDTLAGKDPKQQEQLYRAILTLETPLLSAHALLPSVSSPPSEHDAPPVRVIPDRSTDKEELHPTKPLSSQPIRPLTLQPRFHWTPDTVAHLKHSYEQGTYPSVAKAADELSNALGWPLTAVRNKLYELTGKPKSQQRGSEKEQKEGNQEKEDD